MDNMTEKYSSDYKSLTNAQQSDIQRRRKDDNKSTNPARKQSLMFSLFWMWFTGSENKKSKIKSKYESTFSPESNIKRVIKLVYIIFYKITNLNYCKFFVYLLSERSNFVKSLGCLAKGILKSLAKL